MEKVREIIRLHELGYNQTEIAGCWNIVRSTVQDYLRRAAANGVSYEPVKQLGNREDKALLGKGKRQAVCALETIDFEAVHRELAVKGLTIVLV